MSTSAGDIERALFEQFPLVWAEPWDRVGLIAGDPSWKARRALVSLDATADAVRRAAEQGASVLVTHHPVGLSPLGRLRPGADTAGVIFAAVREGVALIAAHTNLDRSPAGLSALPRLLDLTPVGTLEQSGQPMARVTCFVPADSCEAVVSAMAEAGAGRVGAYERCAFAAQGTGEFVPRLGARPWAGQIGAHTSVEELRVEMVCPRVLTAPVMAAARAAHPYDEPLMVTDEVEIGRGAAGLGMRCAAEGVVTLGDLARRVGDRLGASPRVWGNASRPVTTVVTATGSASSLLGDVRASGAEALICGEVRYHDALGAAGDGLAIIECGHDASEWPLVPVLAEAVRSTPGIDADSVIVDETSVAWWTP